MNEPRLFGVSPDEFRRLRDIFESALGRPLAQRSRYVERACAGDAALIGEVERMLRADGEHNRFLDGSVLLRVHRQGTHDIPLDSLSARMTTAATSAGFQKSTAHLPVGSSVNGRYRVEGLIGEGGVGVVYRVRDDLHPERALALKTIRNQELSAAQLALFKAEFRTMAQLAHPHIAAVYDFEPIQGTADYFYTLDYVDGSDLFDASHHDGWKTILDLLVQVAQALAYIHSRRIVHLDLKPANVILDHANNVKVLDFGVAAAWARLDQGVMLGTPAYMPPEIFDGIAVDHRADLYAFGIMAYQLLCRRLPFASRNLADLCGQHRSEPISFSDTDRENLPEWLRHAIRKLCAKDPADRYRSAASFIESLNRQGGLSYDVETEQTRDSYLLSSRFVGREPEFNRLSDFIAGRAGQDVSSPAALCVVGPSGIGKSRLINQVRQQVQVQGTAFLESSCLENAFDEYGPVANLVNHAVRLATAASGAGIVERYGPELVKVAPELAVTHSCIASPPMADSGHERTRVHTAAADFFLAVSELVPFVACVNDLHWARAGTADLLGTLLGSIELREKRLGRRVQICFLGSYRSDEIQMRPFARVVARQLADVIELKPLSRDEVGESIISMLGIEELPAAFVERVSREAAGNPFFVQEIMRILINAGSVYAQGGEWAAREDIRAIDIPTSLALLLERRVALLSQQERELLTLFAAYGRPLPFDLALQLTGLRDSDLAGLLLDLERKQILVFVDESSMTFALVHDRLRETYYESLPEEVRVQWHGRIAACIERTFAGDLEPHYYDLSRHCTMANRSDAALEYSLLGAGRAKATLAHGTAIEMLERALSLTQDAGQRQQIESDLADVQSLVGGYDRALELYEALLARSHDPLQEARFWRGISTIHFYKGNMQPSLDAIWQSVRLLGGSAPAHRGKAGVIIGMLGALAALAIGKLRGFPRPRHPTQRAERLELASTYQRMSTLYYFVFPPGMMLVNLRAWLVARPWGPSDQLAQAYAMLGFIFGGVIGKHGLARRLSEAALHTVQQVPSTWQDGFVRARIGTLAIFRGDYSEAISQLTEAKRRLQLHGDYAELGFAWVNLSQAYYFQGRFKEGYALALEGYELFERIGSDMVARQFLSMVAVMGALIGIRSEIGKVRDGIARSQLCRDYTCQCIGMVKLGAVHAALGEYDNALFALEQAKKVRSERGVKFHYADMLDILELDIRLKMSASTRGLGWALKKNRRIARLRPAYAPWVALNEANYALSCARRSEALAHYDRARKLATQQGARHLLASVHVDMARADPANSRTHLQQALALHRECGAVHDEHRVEAALESLL